MKIILTNSKKHITKTALALAVATILGTTSTYADSSTCNSCEELSSITNNTAQIAANTSVLGSIVASIQGGLINSTRLLFDGLPDDENSPAEFSAIPAVQAEAFKNQRTLLSAVEKNYQGVDKESQTPIDSYSDIFGTFLLKNDDGTSSSATFDIANASAASLFLDPSKAGYYDSGVEGAQKSVTAEKYVQLLSGAALSTQRLPAPWLKSDGSLDGDKHTRKEVSQFYTFSAVQSLVADNLSYIYGMNAGQDITDGLDNYEGSKISESGLIKYIQLEKVESSEWYELLGTMTISGILQEQAILIAGAFLELVRIEQLLRRQLATESASTAISLTMAQGLTKLSAKMDAAP